MSLARGAAIAALIAAVVVVVVLVTGGNGQTTYHLRLTSATLLVKDNDVQISGRRVGSIRDITLTGDNEADIKFVLSNDFAPLHAGTTALVRQSSLSGIANRYISLTPGPNDAPKIPDDGTITAEHTTSAVSLDQLFDTLDPKTLRDLQHVVQGQATWYQGREKQANEAARYFNPAISTTTNLVNELTLDQKKFTDFVVNSSKLVTAVAEKRDDLASLIGNTNTTTRAIASESTSLEQALGLLPGTLRRANTTFVNLRSTLTDLDRLVNANKPVAPKLAPFFRALRPLVKDSRPTIRDLSKLVHAKGADNDTIDLLNKQPRLTQVASTTFNDSIAGLKKSQPVLDFIRPYAPDFVGWLRDFGQGAANYDANGHYARIQPMFNAFSFADNPAGGTLTPLPPALRQLGLTNGYDKRCPGSATQARPDGSNPFLDDGSLQGQCDPSQVPPGP